MYSAECVNMNTLWRSLPLVLEECGMCVRLFANCLHCNENKSWVLYFLPKLCTLWSLSDAGHARPDRPCHFIPSTFLFLVYKYACYGCEVYDFKLHHHSAALCVWDDFIKFSVHGASVIRGAGGLMREASVCTSHYLMLSLYMENVFLRDVCKILCQLSNLI